MDKYWLSQCLLPLARLVEHGQGLRRVWAYTRLRAAVQYPVPPSVVIEGSAEVHGSGRVRLGERLYLYPGLYLETREHGEIQLGADVVCSRGVHLVAYQRIEIGAGSMLGEYVSVRDANHRRDPEQPLRTSGHHARPICIGQQVWIGRGVMILPGVCIGDRAVIGANAVVTHDVPANSVVMGVPARARA